MDESVSSGPDDSAATGKAASEGPKFDVRTLPVVVAPKLGAGDEEMDEELDEDLGEGVMGSAEDTAAAGTPVHSTRFLVLAAAVAFAAAFGSFVGSVSGSGLARFVYPAPIPHGVENTTDAMRDMKLELAELATLKVSLDSASRASSGQFAKIADRLDRLDQRTAAAATSAPETTGSIAPASNTPPAADPGKAIDRILDNWVVQDVQNGRALVESRFGGVFDVGAGSVLPGVGRVDAVKRQDGQWVVLTARGTITSGH